VRLKTALCLSELVALTVVAKAMSPNKSKHVWYSTPSAGKVLFDGTNESKGRPGVADSPKVDVYGNIFAAAPGGLFILATDGRP